MIGVNRTAVIAAVVVCTAVTQTFGQDFEVASVKPSRGGPEGFWNEGSAVRMLNKSLRAIIAAAYGERDHAVSGPGWLDDEHYEIIAKLSPETVKLPDAERWMAIRTMSQHLLADRFHLQVHRENRDTRAYALVPASRGTRLVQTGPPSTTWVRVAQGRGSLVAKQMPMPQLISILGGIVHFQVLDETGVSGVFDISLEWQPEESDRSPTSAVANKLPLAAALEEQAGLKLDARKISTQVIVVDRVERPTGN